MASKRYTAIIEIVEVTETESYREYGKDFPAGKESRELSKFTVRDADLDKLKEKVTAHVTLV